MKDSMKRRDFLKVMGVGSVYLIAKNIIPGGAVDNIIKVSQLAPTDGSGKRWGMVIDVGACIGCRQCTYACKEENSIPNAPLPLQWIETFEMDQNEPITHLNSVPSSQSRTAYTDSPIRGKWYLPTHCLHCENPPCVRVCPTGATFKSEDGIVEMDYDKCIGCRQCMAACPYNARTFNWGKPQISEEDVNPLVPVRAIGVVEKCSFCQHRVREGKLPKCVEACPVGAKHFGDLNDPNSPPSKLLDTYISSALLEEFNTGPKVLYITSGKKWFEEEEF
jgi:molybdopterin-containing oxidoreductase family iron-sulfur binding subunit